MARYIDVEPFKDCKIVLHNEDKGVLIKDIPTANVQEVKHGEWDYVNTEENVYMCDCCGNTILLLEGTPDNNNFSYCPYCGAKMDKESEDK